MPDVGLLTATEPLASDLRVVIKYSVEVEGLAVYQESYDVDTLTKELKTDPDAVAQRWLRRLRCAVAARPRPGFSAALTRCLTDGYCADCGHERPEPA